MADQRKFVSSSTTDEDDELEPLEGDNDDYDSNDPFGVEFSSTKTGRSSSTATPEDAFKDLVKAAEDKQTAPEKASEVLRTAIETQSGASDPLASWQTRFAGEAAKLLGFDPDTGNAILDLKSAYSRNFSSLLGEVTRSARGLWRGTDGSAFESLRIGAQEFLRSETGELCRLLKFAGRSIALLDSSIKSVGLDDSRLEFKVPGEGTAEKEMPRGRRGTIDVIALEASNNYASENSLSQRIPDGFRTAGRNHVFESNGSFKPADRAATVVDRTKDTKLNEVIADAKERFAALPPEERAKALAKYVHDLIAPPGTAGPEQEQAYRALMKEHAGKSLLLSEFLGKGSCTQEALLLKVLADELGLKSQLVRGNNGTHAWTTFDFATGERKIFDSRAGILGVDESKSEFHKPDAPNQSQAQTKVGDRVEHNGEHWTVSGFDTETGRLILTKPIEKDLATEAIAKLSGGAEPQPGDKVTVTENGVSKQWTVEGRTADGAWRVSSTEAVKVERAELAASPLELANHPNADMRWVQSNWDSLIKDNTQLTDKQRQNLEAARDGLAARSPAPAEQIKAFRDLLTEAKRLSTAGDTTASRRIKSLTQVAETIANHPDTVHVSAKKLIGANDVLALEIAASKLAEVAPHLEIPSERGVPKISNGLTYESHASQALMKALTKANLSGGQWVYVPSTDGSAADHLKFDGMLINLSNGEYLPVDLAMHEPGHQKGDYQTFEKKLREGRLWGLTLDTETMGFGKDGKSFDGILREAEIIKRIESFRKGTQSADLKVKGTQSAPKVNKLVDLVNTLGKVPSFIPVNSELEAEATTRSTGEPCKPTSVELEEMRVRLEAVAKGRATSNLDAPSGMLMEKGARDGGNRATEVVYSTELIETSLRAAVEARKYGTNPAPPIDASRIKVDTQGGFIEIAAGDVTTRKNHSNIRIHSDGRIEVQPRLNSSDWIKLGKLSDLSRDVLPKLREMGIDPKPVEQALRRLHTTNLANLEADLKTVVDAKTAETFWTKYKDLGLIVEAVNNVQANVPLAQEARRVYSLEQEIKQHRTLNVLTEADRIALAQKTAKLNQTRPDLSIEDAHAITEMENACKVSQAEAIKYRDFQNGLGSEAAAWKPEEVQAKLKAVETVLADYPGRSTVDVHKLEAIRTRLALPDAKSAMLVFELAKGMPPGTSDLALKQAYEVHKTLEKVSKGFGQVVTPADSLIVAKKFPNLTEAEAKEIVLQRKALRSGDYTKIVEATEKAIALKNLKPLIDGAAAVWKENAVGEIPKEPTQDFLECLEMARKNLEGKLDPARLQQFDDMIVSYRAEVKAGKSAASPVADMVHGFITAPSNTGKPGEGLWRPSQGIPPGEQAALRRQLGELGRNPLADRANMQEYIREMSKVIDKWSTDLQPDAREVESQTRAVNEARRRLQALALQEAGNPLAAANLMQNPEKGSPTFIDAHKRLKEMSDARDLAAQKLETECKTRLAELQKTMNDYATKHGLPKVELKMASSLPGADALYGLGRGTIVLSQADLLNKSGGTQMLGKGYHELIHFQQDVLVSRNVMDQMKLGNGLSTDAATRAKELAEFKRIYKEKTGVELPDAPAEKAAEWHKFVDEVAKKRNGATLDVTDAKRADAFAKAFKEGKPFTERYAQIADAVTNLETERAKLSADRPDTRTAEDLVSRLAAETADGERLRKEFFGDKAEGKLKELVDAWKRAPKDGSGKATIWNEEAARKIIQDHIGDPAGRTGRIGQLNTEARDLHAKFMALVEQEAHLLAGDVHSSVADKVVDAAYQRGAEAGDGKPVDGWKKVAELNGGKDQVLFKPKATPTGDPTTRSLDSSFNPNKPDGYTELKFEGRPEGVRFFMDTKTNEVFVYSEIELAPGESLKSMVRTFDVEVMPKAQAEARLTGPASEARIPVELARATAVPLGSVEFLEVDPLTGRLKRTKVGLAGDLPKIELNERSLDTLLRGWEKELDKQIDELKNDPSKKTQYEEAVKQKEALAGVRGELAAGGERARAVVEHFKQSTERGAEAGRVPEAVGGRFGGRVVVGGGIVIGVGILFGCALGYYNRVVEPEKKRRSGPTLPSLGK